MTSAWKLLHSKDDFTLPPLFVQHDFGATSYTIWLTDLTTIWMESMARRDIIKRAFALDTSIDPSEDSEQFHLLLKSIEKALRQEDGSDVELLPTTSKNDELTLSTLTVLPGPLKPLKWSVELCRAPSVLLTRRLLLPLLAKQSQAKVEKNSLLHIVREKDNVINKLTEWMQSDGKSLSAVFPSALASKYNKSKSQREALARSVKGLAEFNQEQWQIGIPQQCHSLAVASEMVSVLDTISMVHDSELPEINEKEEWWKELGDAENKKILTAPEVNKIKGPINENMGSRINDRDFHRRLTSPQRYMDTVDDHMDNDDKAAATSSGARTPKTMVLSNDSTTDESDCGPRPSKIRPQSPDLDLKKSRLGNAKKTEENSVVQHRDCHDILHDDGDPDEAVKDSEKGRLSPMSCYDETSTAPIPTTPKVKAKLGKIGGKNRTSTASEKDPRVNTSTIPDRVSTNEVLPGTSKSSLWTASERKDKADPHCKSPTPPRETSMERANRRREELKRTLETKSPAVKKKRKF